MNEISLAYSYSIDNKYYLGASLGIPSIRFESNSIYTESDSSFTVEKFKKLYFEELLQTRGTGINLKLGGIARVNSYLRMGAYFHSPTIIRLNDVYESYLEVNYDTLFGYSNLILSDSSGQGEFSYSITTPMRAGASIAVLYNKLIAFNVDYEYINYSQGYLNSKPNYFQTINKEIRSKYKSTANLRLGTEINLSPFAFRLGFASYGSPFGDVLSGKFIRNTYSIGGGYRPNEKWFIDLAILQTRFNENYYLYNPELISRSEILRRQSQLIITIGLKF
jgi:long-subunit fatty acid transport protein